MGAVRAEIFNINQGEYGQRVKSALCRHFANDNNPVKRLALIADVSVGTAKNWLDGTSTPQGLHLLRLMVVIPELSAEVRRLQAMEADLDPQTERAVNTLLVALQRRLGA